MSEEKDSFRERTYICILETSTESQPSEWLIVKTKSKKYHKLILTNLKSSDLSKESMRLVVCIFCGSDPNCPCERAEHDTDMFSSCPCQILNANVGPKLFRIEDVRDKFL